MSPNNTLTARRSIRLRNVNYSSIGQYFVTICAFQMHCLFGKIDGETVVLNVIGRIALDCWRDIPFHFSHVELDPFVVMPNHIHGILTISGYPANGPTEDGHGCPVPLQGPNPERFQHPTVGSLPTIIRSYKGAVTYNARQHLKRASLQVWQSNYYERVLRNGKEFSQASRYIFENPTKWDAACRGTGHPCPSFVP
jgi:REP-associated tyrosine transposase